MTASEFAFLSFGFVFGTVGGAALVEIVRSRPASPRVIRVTVTPNSIPGRKPATLAEAAFTGSRAVPDAEDSADDRIVEPVVPELREDRTVVRSLLPPAGSARPGSGLPLSRIVTTRPMLGIVDRHRTPPSGPRGDRRAEARSGVAIHLEPDPQLDALLHFRFGRVEHEPTSTSTMRASAAVAVAVAEPPSPSGTAPLASLARLGSSARNADDARPAASSEDGGAAPQGSEQDATGGCAEARRVADERCALASLARDQADAAREAVRAAQRAYDEHMTRAEGAATAADPRAIRSAKERAQQSFRDARAAASTRDGVEAAARDWLNEINRINRAARDASTMLLQEREAAHGLVTTIERLTVEADTARVAAEAADATCLAARQAVADCDEAEVTSIVPATGWPAAPSVGLGGGSSGPIEDETELGAALGATGAGEPTILRLLRGDRAVLGRVVHDLAGDDPAERRRWQLALAGLVDAIVARAIEAAFLNFPVDHPFWGANSLDQSRDVASALSSLGYRFDGLNGWADDRIPSQRDLSLAVGYAGLDPMRTRRWPSEREMHELFRDVTVAADEYLASAAGELTLGELISVLGRRADGLADLWNEWGRVRPLLLSGG